MTKCLQESRMREICTSGSMRGSGRTALRATPLPLSTLPPLREAPLMVSKRGFAALDSEFVHHAKAQRCAKERQFRAASTSMKIQPLREERLSTPHRRRRSAGDHLLTGDDWEASPIDSSDLMWCIRQSVRWWEWNLVRGEAWRDMTSDLGR